MGGHNVRSYDPTTGDDVDIIGGRLVFEGGVVEGVLKEATAVTFTEDGEGVYTGSVTLPAGSVLVDIIVHAEALWTAGTSATMDVGDVADPNGFFAGVNLKATDLLAGESISFNYPGGKAGAYIDTVNGHVKQRYSSTERVISGVVTASGTAGDAGLTRMVVLYTKPTVEVAATKA